MPQKDLAAGEQRRDATGEVRVACQWGVWGGRSYGDVSRGEVVGCILVGSFEKRREDQRGRKGGRKGKSCAMLMGLDA